MATYFEQIQELLDLAIAAQKAALTNPQPNYSIEGETVDFKGYMDAMDARIQKYRELLVQEPFEFVSIGG